MKFLRPDLYLAVLDLGTADFKESAQQFLDRADAVVLHQTGGHVTWTGVSLKPVSERPVFQICPPQYVTAEMVEYVRKRILTAEDAEKHRGRRKA